MNRVAVFNEHGEPEMGRLERRPLMTRDSGAVDWHVFWKGCSRRIYQERPGLYYITRKKQRHYLELRL